MKKLNKGLLLALLAVAALSLDTCVTYRLATKTRVRVASASIVLPEAAEDPLASFRLEREQLRAREQAGLNDIIYNGQSDAGMVAAAQRSLLELMERSEQELTLEGILQARGYDDALVTVHQNSANVLLRDQTLTQRESAVILEVVMRETGLTGGNVKIIPVK